MPNTSATARATTALDRLARPGRARPSSVIPPGRVDDPGPVQHPARRRAAEPTLAAAPAHVVPAQVRAALRAAPGVLVPALARRHPGHLGRAHGRPGDQRVVRVGHHPAPGRLPERVPPAPGHQPDLRRPVHLVPAEVEQHHHPGLGRLDHPGQVLLVHFEHRVRGLGRLAQRGGQARLHVGAERVRGDLLAERAERRGDQPGRGRLAVGPGDQDDLAVRGEQGEQARFHPQPDDPADDGPVTTACEPRHPACGTAQRGGHAGPDRKLAHGRRCYPAPAPARQRSYGLGGGGRATGAAGRAAGPGLALVRGPRCLAWLGRAV